MKFRIIISKNFKLLKKKSIVVLGDLCSILKQFWCALLIFGLILYIVKLKNNEDWETLSQYGVCTIGEVYEISYRTGKNTYDQVRFNYKQKYKGCVKRKEFIDDYGDTSLYIGKKVKVKYVPANPENAAFLKWDEPCLCDSNQLKKATSQKDIPCD